MGLPFIFTFLKLTISISFVWQVFRLSVTPMSCRVKLFSLILSTQFADIDFHRVAKPLGDGCHPVRKRLLAYLAFSLDSYTDDYRQQGCHPKSLHHYIDSSLFLSVQRYEKKGYDCYFDMAKSHSFRINNK